MHQTLRGVDTERLERSCSRSGDSIRFGTGAPGLERAEARFAACSFEPHRHDTYAIGITIAGVQTFRYRGRRRVSLPGQIHILHPDETHDGGPGTESGFAYRIVYVEPELIRRALDGGPLPFVSEPVHDRSPATHRLARLVHAIDDPISDLGRHEIAVTIADALRALSRGGAQNGGSINLAAVERVREHLASHAREQTPARTLEQIAGIDRFTIARHFRRAFGTSPDRYRTMRRLALARAAIESGLPLATAAAEAGFADQSHMTRQFTSTYGLTPGRWVRAVATIAPATG
jgi:AraC-like DNA-binding protein